ncbi:hypothetical protein GCM10026988_31990 [Vibrio panuliri]
MSAAKALNENDAAIIEAAKVVFIPLNMFNVPSVEAHSARDKVCNILNIMSQTILEAIIHMSRLGVMQKLCF